jgi:hypothetical protein
MRLRLVFAQAALILTGNQLSLANSPWRSPISPHAVYSADPVPAGINIGLDTWLQADPWSIPFYRKPKQLRREKLLYNAGAWYMVATGRWMRFGNSPATERAILASSSARFPAAGNIFSTTDTRSWKLPGSFNRVRNPEKGSAIFWFPADATPSPGPDGHMAVEQPGGTVLETYATIILHDGAVVALSYSVTNPAGLEDGWQNGQTASMIPCYAGLIADREAETTGIRHAIAITIPARMLAPKALYPAFAFDRDALNGNPPYSGTIPMGGRLALPPHLNLAMLHLSTAEGRRIAQAAQTYGFIIVDRGGEGITLRIRRNGDEPDRMLRRFNKALHSDLREIFAHVRLVTEANRGAAHQSGSETRRSSSTVR